MKEVVKKISATNIPNIVVLVFTLYIHSIHKTEAIDNLHFYRASYFWGEPRFEEPWLFTADVSGGWGTTRHARNSRGTKVPLLSIFGPESIHMLGTNVPSLDPSNMLDALLLELSSLPARSTFGKLSLNGRFEINESNINIYQNLINGFFLQGFLPIRRLVIDNINIKDLTPRDGQFPHAGTPIWQRTLSYLNQILERHGISLKPAHKTGIGDLSLLFGWTINYQETKHADYIDANAKVGVLFPTSPQKDTSRPFDLPLGYNGHYGIPVLFDASFGAFDWFTAGFHISALFLLDRTMHLRVKTAPQQNGFLKLAKQEVKVDAGTLWSISTYIKADHIVKGLSLLIGYSYNRKDRDELEPTKNNEYPVPPIIINGDPERRGWAMHVLHVLTEYDFATQPNEPGWRLGFFYNHVLAGQRIFTTPIKALNAGLDVGIKW